MLLHGVNVAIELNPRTSTIVVNGKTFDNLTQQDFMFRILFCAPTQAGHSVVGECE